MKQTKRFIAIIVCALFAMSTWAQVMTFTYEGGATATASEMTDGSWLMQLPAGTDLNDAITGVKVNGTAVDAASVVPNPTETFITEGEIETFVYDGKAYSFRFTAGEYFTMVVFSDPHVAQDNYEGITVADMQDFVKNVVNMGKTEGKMVTFKNAPKGYVPTADIVFCLGDMDEDKSNGKDFKKAIAGFNDAGIPFITMAGNHDFVPYLWDDGSKGATIEGTSADKITLEVIADQNTTAAKKGGFEITTFTQKDGEVQPKPFAFNFKGIDFYCGQTYWYQMPYSGCYAEVMGNVITDVTYYAPDGIIDALNTYVSAREGNAAVWMQHYTFNSGSDCDRWWLDQNKSGATIAPTKASAYTTAMQKKNKLIEIINKTKNPVHFSGHMHNTENQKYSTLTDYVIGHTYERVAYVVLCKGGVGVIEVQETTF